MVSHLRARAAAEAAVRLNDEFGAKTVSYIRFHFGNSTDKIKDFKLFEEMANGAKPNTATAKEAFNSLKTKVESENLAVTKNIAVANPKYSLYNGLKWGATIFTVALAATDIVLTSIAMYKYYHVEHIQIPHHMVDISYSENEEAAYVAYKSVRDQDGHPGDLNAGSSRQWLALYYTKDTKAGSPIVAPGTGSEIVVKTGDSQAPEVGYTPLHIFGTPNVAQNLTFADGDNGYSYNDKNNGTYLFFTHADVNYSDPMEKLKDAGTALGTGVIALIGAGGIVIGIFIGAVIVGARRKKREKTGTDGHLMDKS